MKNTVHQQNSRLNKSDVKIGENLYIFCLKVAVWILPEARVQTVGTR